jgi:polysaccharide biosynthesis/export protein ExoF
MQGHMKRRNRTASFAPKWLRWIRAASIPARACTCAALAACAISTAAGTLHAAELDVPAIRSDAIWSVAADTHVAPDTRAPDSAAAIPKDAFVPKLGPGDRIRIKIYEREDLSGEYGVREDGSILVPILGRINAGGLVIGNLEEAVVRKLFEVTQRTGNVSVDISHQRPVYVVGVIDKPGTYPYVRGMTVLQALAMSGGFHRLTASTSLALDASREAGNVLQNTERLKLALARQSRLTTELRNAPDVEIPPRLLQLTTPEEAKSLIAVEKNLLAQRRAVRRQQSESVDQEISSVTETINALQSQKAVLERRVGTSSKDLDEVRQFARKGLTTRLRVQGVDREASDAEVQLSSNIALLARSKRELETLKRGKDTKVLELQAEIDQQHKAADEEIRGLEVTLGQSSTLIRQITGGQLGAVDPNKQPTPIYEIVRTEETRVTTTKADETSFLYPGDVLRVTYANPSGTGAPVSQPVLADAMGKLPPLGTPLGNDTRPPADATKD